MENEQDFEENWESLDDLEEQENEDEDMGWDDEEGEWDRDSYFDEDGFLCSGSEEEDDFDYDESDYEEE